MFGYVTPCIQELKVKDYYKFKSYYCGLCKSLKNNYGEIPRFSLNYDMTFLAIFIDSLSHEENEFEKCFCAVHPLKKNLILKNNQALNYAAFCNLVLFYYKVLDDYNDEKNLKTILISHLFKPYVKNISLDLKPIEEYIKSSLKNLYHMENSKEKFSLDQLSEPFADLTGFLISDYFKKETFKQEVYWFGYNLGKWIYIIDAFDDLEMDMKKGRFNAINHCLNHNNMCFYEFSKEIESRIEFTLVTCANTCLNYIKTLPINKNKPLLENILIMGLMEKMDKVFKRSEFKNE